MYFVGHMEQATKTPLTDRQKSGCYLTFIKLAIALALIGFGLYYFLRG